MVKSSGVKVDRVDAEATRRRLQELQVLRTDLQVLRTDDAVIFPVSDGCGPKLPTATYDFQTREVPASSYQELLPIGLRETAPRAYDRLGDIIIVKIPVDQEANAAIIGKALLDFHRVRAVFHDDGVTGEFRVRALQLIAGHGSSQTVVQENGVQLNIDPGAAYYSPRLGSERARIAALCDASERVIDLFGGVGPQAMQLAKLGCEVVCVDLNPAAAKLATKNAQANNVPVDVRCGDARVVAKELAPANRLIMNLPHGAYQFLDLADQLLLPGGTLHYHEIMDRTVIAQRITELETMFGHRKPSITTRNVRTYSTIDDHTVFDVKLEA